VSAEMTRCIFSLGRPVPSRSRSRGPPPTYTALTLYRSQFFSGQLFLVRATRMSMMSRAAEAEWSVPCFPPPSWPSLRRNWFSISHLRSQEAGRANRAWTQRRAQREALDCPDELQWTQQVVRPGAQIRNATAQAQLCRTAQRKRSEQTEGSTCASSAVKKPR